MARSYRSREGLSSRSCSRKKSQGSVRDATTLDKPAIELSKSRKMRIRQTVVETGKIVVANEPADTGRLMSLFGEVRKMREAPIPRRDQTSVRVQCLTHVGRPLGHPDREHKRLIGPLLPGLTEIIDIRIPIALRRTQNERCVANDKPRIGYIIRRFNDIANFGVAGHEARA